MAEAIRRGWDRRDFLQGGALLALAIGVPGAAVALSRLDPDDAPTRAQQTMMRTVAQLVLPRTDTPGAGDVGAGEFALLGLAHGLEGARKLIGGDAMPNLQPFRRPDGSLRHAAWLERELDRRSRGQFLARGAAEQAQALGSLDAEAFAAPGDHPWKIVKALILTGYYTSEAGGSQELRYEPVPGKWDPDLPLKPGDRAISNDWTAVDFG